MYGSVNSLISPWRTFSSFTTRNKSDEEYVVLNVQERLKVLISYETINEII